MGIGAVHHPAGVAAAGHVYQRDVVDLVDLAADAVVGAEDVMDARLEDELAVEPGAELRGGAGGVAVQRVLPAHCQRHAQPEAAVAAQRLLDDLLAHDLVARVADLERADIARRHPALGMMERQGPPREQPAHALQAVARHQLADPRAAVRAEVAVDTLLGDDARRKQGTRGGIHLRVQEFPAAVVSPCSNTLRHVRRDSVAVRTWQARIAFYSLADSSVKRLAENR